MNIIEREIFLIFFLPSLLYFILKPHRPPPPPKFTLRPKPSPPHHNTTFNLTSGMPLLLRLSMDVKQALPTASFLRQYTPSSLTFLSQHPRHRMPLRNEQLLEGRRNLPLIGAYRHCAYSMRKSTPRTMCDRIHIHRPFS